MGNTINEKKFVAQFYGPKQHGVIDTNKLSPELKKAMADAGVSEADLKKLAGPDGQIKQGEFKKLFKVVDGFDDAPGDKKVSLSGKSGAFNDALKAEVTRNAAAPEYAKPGTRAAATQTRATIAANALTVAEKDRKPAVDLAVKGMSQYDYAEKNGLDGDKACFATAKAQCETYNSKAHGKKAPAFNAPDQAIQVGYAEDKAGRLAVDKKQAEIGRAYIDKVLDEGYPALVGISYDDKAYNHDKLTDHFVSIHKRGYDDAGRLYYEFKDPGANGNTGRLYVDKDTGKLFKEGSHKNRYVESADYEVSQVRTYKGVE